jgi:sporulation protein YlmC with PRC-barrel domain
MHARLDQLSGRLVLDATGSILGHITAPLVDMETWSIDALRVSLSRHAAAELELEWQWWAIWKRPAIDIPSGVVQAAGEAILLRVSLGELREAAPQMIGEPASPAIH